MNGFLGTGATLYADINLLVQLAMGLALLYGWRLARRQQFTAHKYCQSSVMLLNLVMIFLVMLPSFHRQVQPQIADGLQDAYYLVAFVHAGLGTLAELLGIYIVLVAATNLLPKRLRFDRYRPWMRTELALWWVVLVFGLGTYYFWYLRPAPAPPAAQAAEAQKPEAGAAQTVVVRITNFQFEPKAVTVRVGATIEWVDEVGRHNVEADDGSFKSATLSVGGRFAHTFTAPGAYPYFCMFHGDKGMQEMAGVVTVE